MKKLVLIILASAMVLALSACGEKCSIPDCGEKVYEDGYCEYHYSVICRAENCEDEVYKDGYCQYHYTKNAVDDAAKDLFDGFFGD